MSVGGHRITKEMPVSATATIVRSVGEGDSTHDVWGVGGDESRNPDSNRGPAVYETAARNQLSYSGEITNKRVYSRRPSRESRFSANIDFSAGPDGCWPWKASCTSDGYGRFCRGLAHRFALELKLGRRLEKGEQALHDPRVCNNPPCCNPAHLRVGTVRDNALDRLISGTQRLCVPPKGEAHGNAKLTDDAVREILEGYRAASAWGSRGVHFNAMAAKFGVNRRTVEYIVYGHSWAHVGVSR